MQFNRIYFMAMIIIATWQTQRIHAENSLYQTTINRSNNCSWFLGGVAKRPLLSHVYRCWLVLLVDRVVCRITIIHSQTRTMYRISFYKDIGFGCAFLPYVFFQTRYRFWKLFVLLSIGAIAAASFKHFQCHIKNRCNDTYTNVCTRLTTLPISEKSANKHTSIFCHHNQYITIKIRRTFTYVNK